MLRFPLAGVLDEPACDDFLLHILHPLGWHSPRAHPLGAAQAPQRPQSLCIAERGETPKEYPASPHYVFCRPLTSAIVRRRRALVNARSTEASIPRNVALCATAG